jgi:hypothetical protein
VNQNHNLLGLGESGRYPSGSILTADLLITEIEEARAQASLIAYEESSRLEAALFGGSDFRPALRKFLDKLKFADAADAA